MIGLSLTWDYEIYGDGSGDLQKQIIVPTDTFLGICDAFNAKVTLFVEVAEILKMKELSVYQKDITRIEEQLISAHNSGHEIQLHIHPQWFEAQYLDGTWKMDYSLSTLCEIDSEQASHYINRCKVYLQELLAQSKREYSCEVFRAGSFAMMPTANLYHALLRSQIKTDSSVFKWGRFHSNLLSYDYSNAHSHIYPWYFGADDVNRPQIPDSPGKYCLEVPIYCEHQQLFRFITYKRLKMQNKVKHFVYSKDSHSNRRFKFFNKSINILKKYPKKFDFCKCTFSEMKTMIHNILRLNDKKLYLPVVAIGHSKDFMHKRDLHHLLQYLNNCCRQHLEVVPLGQAVKKYKELSDFS